MAMAVAIRTARESLYVRSAKVAISLFPAASACAKCASFKLASCCSSWPWNARMFLYYELVRSHLCDGFGIAKHGLDH